MATGWNRPETNYSNKLHHLPSFPYTVDQAQSLEHSGHLPCSDHYSDMFDVDQLDPVPPSVLVGLETNNDPNYFNNLLLQAGTNVFPQGITTDACTGYLQEDHHHHQKVADLPQLFDDQNNSLDPIYPLQLINEPSAISGTQSEYVPGMIVDGVTASQFTSEPSAISGTQSEYVLSMLVDGVAASQSASEPSSSAGIKQPRSQKWPDEEKTKLLEAIAIFRGSPRMWEDIRRAFFNGSGRTTNSLKQKFKDMETSATSMSDPKEIYLRARNLAASIRDEKNRKRNRNR